MLSKEQEKFNLIGDVICSVMPSVKLIIIDVFTTEEDNREHCYIVVIFKGDTLSVRNASANSLTANLRELTSMLNGGYYTEVEEYKRLRKIEAIKILTEGKWKDFFKKNSS